MGATTATVASMAVAVFTVSMVVVASVAAMVARAAKMAMAATGAMAATVSMVAVALMNFQTRSTNIKERVLVFFLPFFHDQKWQNYRRGLKLKGSVAVYPTEI